MKTTTTASIELRDEHDNMISILKRNVSVKRALDYFNRHNGVIYRKGTLYLLSIAWN